MTRFHWAVPIGLAAAACASTSRTGASRDAEMSAGDRPSEMRAETPTRRYGRDLLTRPSNLGPEWVWSAQALPSGDPATSVLLIEKYAPAEVSASAPYEYTIRVTNIAGATNLDDVRLTDRVAETGYDFQSSSPAAERSGRELRWNLGHMDAGATKTITVRGIAKAQGRVMSCASAEYTPLVCVSTDVVSPGLELSAFAPAEVVPCDEIPLRFVVKNPGSGRATNVRVAEQLPDGWTVNGKRDLTFDAGTLRTGEQREFTAVARASKTGSFTMKATATADGGLSADASAPTAVRKPRLEITQKASVAEQIYERDTEFTIVVTNRGDAMARDVTLRSEMSGADRIGAAGDGRTAANGTSWRLGDLAPGASRTVSLAASRSSRGSITQSVTAQGWCAEPVTATASAEYRGVPAVLLEVVDATDPVKIGGTTTYTITVVNQGTATDTDVSVKCGLESAVEFVSADGPTQATRSGSDVTFAPLAAIAPKQVVKWFVTVRGVKQADTRFRVTLNTKETGRSVEETEATRIFE